MSIMNMGYLANIIYGLFMFMVLISNIQWYPNLWILLPTKLQNQMPQNLRKWSVVCGLNCKIFVSMTYCTSLIGSNCLLFANVNEQTCSIVFASDVNVDQISVFVFLLQPIILVGQTHMRGDQNPGLSGIRLEQGWEPLATSHKK